MAKAKQPTVTVWLVREDWDGNVSIASAQARKTAKRYIMLDDRADGFECRAHFEHHEVSETPGDARSAWRCKCAASINVAQAALVRERARAARPIVETS